jgi:hypothetical protein
MHGLFAISAKLAGQTMTFLLPRTIVRYAGDG